MASLSRRGRWPLVAVVGMAVLALDQLTKWWALEALDDRSIDLLWSLRLQLTFNTGSAFSMGEGLGPIIPVLALAVVLVLVRMTAMVESRVGATAVGLVLGGAVGNLADRAFRAGDGFFGGAVVDFIDLQWWPVFNLADTAIVVGGVLLALVATRPAAR